MDENEIVKRLSGNADNPMNDALGIALKDLVKMLGEITEFSNRELTSISMLQTNPYMKKLLAFRIKNKKHRKRRHAKEILEGLERVANAIGGVNLLEYLKERRTMWGYKKCYG